MPGLASIGRRGRLRILLAAALAGVAGCAPAEGKARMELLSQGRERALLRSEFDLAASTSGTGTTTVFVSDVPAESLLDGSSTTAQVVHIEILWKPRPGRTPIDPEATNASIRHVVIVDGEVGVYGGAGFVRLRGALDDPRLRIQILDASMSLLEATPGFVDLLSPATLSGRVVAVRSDERARLLRLAVSQVVTDALGETRFVDGAERWDGPGAWVAIQP